MAEDSNKAQEVRQLKSEVAALKELLAVYERSVIEQSSKLEQSLKELRLMQFSIDHASVAAMITGPDTRFLYVNDTACRSLEYSREELLSLRMSHIDSLVSEDTWAKDWRRLKQCGSLTIESQYRTKQGRTFPVEVVLNYVEFNDNEYNYIFAQNITERKRSEELLQKAYQALEDRVEERTMELMHANEMLHREINERKLVEEELQRFAARLERSNTELQNFLYISSHDLQEPLRKVVTFGDRLKKKYTGVLGDQGLDYIEKMKNATIRMQELISDLQIYSLVTTRAQPFGSVDLNTVVQGALFDLAVRIEELGGRLEVGDLPAIDADPLQMRQLFQNLIGNALKFHRKGEQPVVKVNGRLVNGKGKNSNDNATDDGLYQIIVEDNGIGFDEKYAERIFGVFQRLHGRNQYAGTGIGLSICHKIVARHGGSIKAKSTPGQGAAFIVTLPVKQPLTVSH